MKKKEEDAHSPGPLEWTMDCAGTRAQQQLGFMAGITTPSFPCILSGFSLLCSVLGHPLGASITFMLHAMSTPVLVRTSEHMSEQLRVTSELSTAKATPAGGCRILFKLHAFPVFLFFSKACTGRACCPRVTDAKHFSK